MTEAVTPLILIAAVVLLVVWARHEHEKRRTEQLRLTAEQMGRPFSPTGDGALIERLSGFHLFSQGRARKIRNLLHGVSEKIGATEQVEAEVFEYRYTVGGGQHSRTVTQSVMCFRSPELNLPRFALRPENLFHKLGTVVGYQDIDFDTHPRFSASYALRGHDEQQVREVFGAEVLAFFEAQDGVSTEGSGNQLIFYRGKKRIRPEDVSSFIEEGFRVFQLFKR